MNDSSGLKLIAFVSNMRYAVDTVIIVNIQRKQQEMLEKLIKTNEKKPLIVRRRNVWSLTSVTSQVASYKLETF